MKLQGPERRPLRSDRTTGDVTIGDLPVRHLDSSATKLKQFADAIMYHPLVVTGTKFDNLYKFCCENKYSNLPEPFNTCPYLQLSSSFPSYSTQHGFLCRLDRIPERYPRCGLCEQDRVSINSEKQRRSRSFSSTRLIGHTCSSCTSSAQTCAW